MVKKASEALVQYENMLLIRRFEERAARSYTENLIGGYCHLNLGEEAAVVGLVAGLEERDYLFTSYREHGFALARGIEPERVLAELYGREAGVSKGRGGSMHLMDTTKRLYGGWGIVGGQVPLAVGAAWALRYQGRDEVVMVQLGDGAMNTGAVHEAMNLAGLWHLGVVLAVVNNGLGMATTVPMASAEPELYKRAAAYRIKAERVDGLDVSAVQEAARRAVKHARGGEPYFLEVMAERLKGHSVVDPAGYRSQDELAQLIENDPITEMATRLKESGVRADQLESLDKSIIARVNEAHEWAKATPAPDEAGLFAYTYADGATGRLPGAPLYEELP
jgi:pyruvate dehydrogenase E1 component alpha subunit